MGFWSSVGNVVGSAVKAAAEKNRAAKELAFEWEDESDDFLTRKYKHGSSDEKLAAFKALKARYPDEEMRKAVVKEIWVRI